MAGLSLHIYLFLYVCFSFVLFFFFFLSFGFSFLLCVLYLFIYLFISFFYFSLRVSLFLCFFVSLPPCPPPAPPSSTSPLGLHGPFPRGSVVKSLPAEACKPRIQPPVAPQGFYLFPALVPPRISTEFARALHPLLTQRLSGVFQHCQLLVQYLRKI